MIKSLFRQRTMTVLMTRFRLCWITIPISHRFPELRSLQIVSDLWDI